MNKLRKKYLAEREALAAEFGITDDDVADIEDVLPYSSIPDLGDLERVLRAVLSTGARLPKE